eukprot:7315036-Lingulodinium_polyedra.AAC.1
MPLVLGEPPVGLKWYFLPWLAPGLQLWWVLGCLVQPLWPAVSPGNMGRHMLNNWDRWQQWVSMFCDPQ